MSAAPRVCVLGLGKMGAAMARRLRDQGHVLSVWNRTASRAEEVSAEPGPPCAAHGTAAEAVAATAADAVVIVVVLDTAGVLATLAAIAAVLGERCLVNLTSGNPDEGRSVAAELRRAAPGATYIDAAYCGPPTKARAGTGRVFVSGAEVDVKKWEAVLGDLGGVASCGAVGTSRAIDYAVVDLVFANLVCFASNAAMLEKEGVDMDQYFAEAAKRVATVPDMLRMYNGRMSRRDEESYTTTPTATLATWRNFWDSRRPYFEANGIPTNFSDFAVGLIDAAGGAPDGPHQGADISRIQEVVRYSHNKKD